MNKQGDDQTGNKKQPNRNNTSESLTFLSTYVVRRKEDTGKTYHRQGTGRGTSIRICTECLRTLSTTSGRVRWRTFGRFELQTFVSFAGVVALSWVPALPYPFVRPSRSGFLHLPPPPTTHPRPRGSHQGRRKGHRLIGIGKPMTSRSERHRLNLVTLYVYFDEGETGTTKHTKKKGRK